MRLRYASATAAGVSERRYRVRIVAAAQRELARLPPDVVARLRRPVFALGSDPRPPGSALAVGTRLRRIRVGELRVVYDVRDEASEVLIVRIARRFESTYRRVR